MGIDSSVSSMTVKSSEAPGRGFIEGIFLGRPFG